jgi:hypothetical protein
LRIRREKKKSAATNVLNKLTFKENYLVELERREEGRRRRTSFGG